ncbi:hypothetical protein U1Q18_030293 [Sarracenia purpurea var. burkii]
MVSDDSSVGCSPSVSESLGDDSFETPKPKKTTLSSRIPSSDNSFVTFATKRSHSKSGDKKPSTTMFCKLDFKKKSDWNMHIAEPWPSFSEVVGR